MSKENAQMVASYVRCKCCGTILQSLHRHDYKKCGCDNETMIDGGLDYVRCGGVDMQFVETISVFDNEPFSKVRQHAYRVGHGRDMRGVQRVSRLFEMTDEHLQGVLTYGCPKWQKKLINKEIAYRKKRGISLAD